MHRCRAPDNLPTMSPSTAQVPCDWYQFTPLGPAVLLYTRRMCLQAVNVVRSILLLLCATHLRIGDTAVTTLSLHPKSRRQLLRILRFTTDPLVQTSKDHGVAATGITSSERGIPIPPFSLNIDWSRGFSSKYYGAPLTVGIFFVKYIYSKYKGSRCQIC